MLLDVVLGYDCNLKCTYCTITDAMRARRLNPGSVGKEIRAAAQRGVRRVAFTGGEPTIFPELPALVRFAKQCGYEEIKVASNGLRYADPAYLDHLVAAGVTRFHVSMHGIDDAHYERTVQRAGTAALRRRAIANLVARGLQPVADLILKRDTYPDLGRWIADLRAQGVQRFQLWLVSLTDANAGAVDQLPRITELVETLCACFAAARAGGYSVVSLHVPRCFLPGYEDHVLHPGAEGVRVITPDDRFDLSASRLTGGVKPASSCGRCRYRAECPGLRQDYVEQYGTGELSPVG